LPHSTEGQQCSPPAVTLNSRQQPLAGTGRLAGAGTRHAGDHCVV